MPSLLSSDDDEDFDILPSPSLDSVQLELELEQFQKLTAGGPYTTVVTINHDREGSTTRNGARRGAWLH